METFKLKGGILSNLRKMLVFSLSLFLLLNFAGCGSSDDTEDMPQWLAYSSAEGGRYVLTFSKEVGKVYGAETYVPETGDYYELHVNDFAESTGTITVTGDHIAFQSTVNVAVNFEADFTYDSGAEEETVTFRNSKAKKDIGGGDIDNIPVLYRVEGHPLFEGYRAATSTTDAYLYYSLPKQFAYSRNIGLWTGTGGGNYLRPAEIEEDTATFSLVQASIPILFAGKSGVNISYQNTVFTPGYSLGQWVTRANVNAHTPAHAGAISGDARNLYSYLVQAASDGFSYRPTSPTQAQYRPDLTWQGEFETGFITTLLDNSRLRFSALVNGIGTGANYRNVTFAEHIFAFRTISVQIGNTPNEDRSNIVRFHTGATVDRALQTSANTAYKHITETNIEVGGQTVSAIKVDSNFIIAIVTTNVADHTDRVYTIQGIQGSAQTYTWEEIQNAYFIPSQERIIHLSSGNALKPVVYPYLIIMQGDIAAAGHNAGGTTTSDVPGPAQSAPWR
ncbi:MAG: hypothetical protein FWG92_02045 [Leptospirales bacterium]|nr:hypothetical protein [Leptospirales bacterium]